MIFEEVNTLVISGGATRGFALLGAIQFLQDKNVLGQINKCIGTSIGAIIGYLICIGYHPTEIMVILSKNNILEKLSKFDILQVVQGGGVISFSILQEILEKLTIEKIKRFISLGELYDEFGMTLICATYNYSLHCMEYIGPENHPEIPCLVALRMSSSLPFLFEPFKYGESIYIDGGIIDNLPVCALDENDRAIALRLLVSQGKKGNFLDFAMDILTIPVHRLEEINLAQVSHSNCLVVSIPTTGNFFHFTMSNTEKFDLFSNGYYSIKEFFSLKNQNNDNPL